MAIKYDKLNDVWEYRYKEKNGGWHTGHEKTKEAAKRTYEYLKNLFDRTNYGKITKKR